MVGDIGYRKLFKVTTITFLLFKNIFHQLFEYIDI